MRSFSTIKTRNKQMKTIVISTIVLLAILFFSLSSSYKSVELTKIWETDDVFLTPESVVYDSLRNCLYISNFNDKGGFRKSGDTLFDECISKLNLNGDIIEFKWVDSLIGPTGLTIFNDILYVIERGFLTKIDIDKQAIITRFEIKHSGFLNDIAIDKDGTVYISDSRNKKIIRVKDNYSEIWFNDSILEMPNGLYIDNNSLIIGNRGKENLFSLSIPDKSMKGIASNFSNGIDGIKKTGENYLVSWQYDIFEVDKTGSSKIILNTSEGNIWNADFEFIKRKNILVVPTLLSNKVVAYKVTIN